ncbi:MAG: Branched-chain amino acid transporter permease [Thermodesulfobacteriota bacterium]|nr:Branched-chain amino acid transporter permease [Thermodesulfobacteriota bacterium]
MVNPRIKAIYPGCLVLGILLLWPLLSRFLPISNLLLSEILVFGLFGTAFNLALGYTGVLSFGHAAYFGIAAYTTALCYNAGIPLELCLLFGILLGTAAGMLIGFLAFRGTGAYFAITTLAMSMVFYYIAALWISMTNGHEGITGLPKMELFIGIPLHTFVQKYYFILFVVGIGTYALWRLINSPFGKVLLAVRENDQRALTCGYNVFWIKWCSFVFSSAFSALAGCLFVVLFEICDTSILYWHMSGLVLVITLFGGTGRFMGPFVGALVFLLMKDKLSLYIDRWEFFTGAFFVLIVLVLPMGILGSITKTLRLWAGKSKTRA